MCVSGGESRGCEIMTISSNAAAKNGLTAFNHYGNGKTCKSAGDDLSKNG
jgi:hypothetical protein